MIEDAGILREQIVELERQLGLHEDIPIQLDFTPQQRLILGVLLKRELASKENLLFALMQGNCTKRGREPGLKLIEVLICLLRKRLKPHGIQIFTKYEVGYFMTRDMKGKTRALFDQVRAAA
jgi:DNA-binding response OmpR family regulator